MAQIRQLPGGGLYFEVNQDPSGGDYDFDMLEGYSARDARNAFDLLRGAQELPALQRVSPQRRQQQQQQQDYDFRGPRAPPDPMDEGGEEEEEQEEAPPEPAGQGDEAPPPDVAGFYQELSSAQLSDPAESVLTFAGLLADSLDSSAAELIDSRTGLFRPRIQGLLEKTRREIVSLTGNQRITVQALIYDNPEDDSARILFSEVVKYRVLREAAGGAFPKNIYERRTLGADAGNVSMTGGYRLAANQHVRRFNLKAWRLTLDKFRNVVWVRNPLLRRYRAIRAGALARLAALSNLRADAVERLNRIRRAAQVPRQATPGAIDQESEEEEEAQLDNLEKFLASEDTEGDDEGSRESFFSSARIGVAARRAYGTVSWTVAAKIERLLVVARLAREGRDAVLRAMPYVIVMGFSEDYYEAPGYY
jgi:hypothetical protein